MDRIFRCAGFFILSLALVVPTVTPAQEKQDKQDKKDAKDTKKSEGETTEPKTKDTKGKKDKAKAPDWKVVFDGKITALDDKEDKPLSLTVQITTKVAERNTSAEQQLVQQNQQLAQHLLSLQRAKSAQEAQNARNQIANTQRQIEQTKTKLITYKDVTNDVKLQEAEAIRFRYAQPPTPIEPGTGEFMKLTKEELEKGKGTEGYPGYAGDRKGLKTGQIVRVYLWKDTKMPKDSILSDKKGAPKKVDDIQDELNNFRYDVIMIYVIADPPKK